MDLFSPPTQALKLPQLPQAQRPGQVSDRRQQAEGRGDGAEGMSFQGILDDRQDTLVKSGAQIQETQENQGNNLTNSNSETTSPQTDMEQAKDVLLAQVSHRPVGLETEARAELIGTPAQITGNSHPIMIEQMVKSMLGINTANGSGDIQTLVANSKPGAELSATTVAAAPGEQAPAVELNSDSSGEKSLTDGKISTAVSEKTPATQVIPKMAQMTESVEISASKTQLAKAPVDVKTPAAIPTEPAVGKQTSVQPPVDKPVMALPGTEGKINLETLEKLATPKETIAPTGQYLSSEQVKAINESKSPEVDPKIATDADVQSIEQVTSSETDTAVASAANSTASNSEQESSTPEAPLPAMKPVANATSESRVKSVPNTSTELAAKAQKIRGQVIRELSSQMDGRIGQEKITLTLNPEKLGQVEIQFLVKDNDLNIVISASSTEAEQAIREGIKELSDGIADKSGRWNQVDIKVDQRGQEQDKNDNKQDAKRDSTKKEENTKQQQQQKNQNHPQAGAPDWASLVSEG